MIYTLPHNCQIKDLDKIYEEYFPDNYQGIFVDVGAYNGYDFSNTYPLLLNGWYGIGFEPNPSMSKICQELYEQYNGIVYNKAIGEVNAHLKLYLAGTLSTTSLETLKKYEKINWSKDLVNDKSFIQVEQLTLDTALKDILPVNYIDVMSIDTEGTEDKVLAGLSNYKVKMFIIETHEFAQEQELNITDRVEVYLSNYNKIYSDEINSIYVRKE